MSVLVAPQTLVVVVVVFQVPGGRALWNTVFAQTLSAAMSLELAVGMMLRLSLWLWQALWARRLSRRRARRFHWNAGVSCAGPSWVRR